MYVSFLFVSCHDLKIDALSRFALEEGSIAATCNGWHTAFYPHYVCGSDARCFRYPTYAVCGAPIWRVETPKSIACDRELRSSSPRPDYTCTAR